MLKVGSLDGNEKDSLIAEMDDLISFQRSEEEVAPDFKVFSCWFQVMPLVIFSLVGRLV